MLLLTPEGRESRKSKIEPGNLQPGLIELLRQAHDTVVVLKSLALSQKVQKSAIDLFKIDLDLAARCLYLCHPGQAISGLFHWEHFLRILLHGAVPLPQL